LKEAARLLKRAGFDPGAADGRATPALERALREFQRAWGLPATGTLSSATEAKLRETAARIAEKRGTQHVSIGQKSDAIRTIERQLERLGYDVGQVDGIYSRETAAAVRAFKADQKDIRNDAGAIAKWGRTVLAREVRALAHAPERRRIAATKAQQQLDLATKAAVSRRRADGAVGLGEGATGRAVANVQRHLRAAGYAPKRTDGVFDERTRGAVEAFQRHSRLPVTGRVDGRTWRVLERSLIEATGPASPAQARGERSGAVKKTERLLQRLGFRPGRVDGFFSKRTESAVRAFERRHGLRADGRLDAREFEKLRSLARTRGGVEVTPEMRRLASAARSVALSMGGYSGLGRCATGVSAAIRRALGLQVWGNGNQIDNNLPRSRFREVKMPLAQALKIPGLVLTWERTSSSLGRIYGHTAITLGDGRSSASDFVERNTLAAESGRSGLKIFVPVR
jgi:peptidoglycan hydrolase-like protein with peptidoglycan-binding domain